jgi:hypothetical protein
LQQTLYQLKRLEKRHRPEEIQRAILDGLANGITLREIAAQVDIRFQDLTPFTNMLKAQYGAKTLPQLMYLYGLATRMAAKG